MFSKKILTNELFFCSNGGMVVSGGGRWRMAVPAAATGTGRKTRANVGAFFNLLFSKTNVFEENSNKKNIFSFKCRDGTDDDHQGW